MVLHDGSTVYADTAAEVLSELLPGYQELDAQARRRTRIRHAQQVAGLVQRLQLEQAIAQGEFDQSDPGQAALADILTTDKSVSLGLELPDAPGRAADWLPQLPLVLVTTNYAPHTRYPRVGGNVVWIDPADEVGYLASLHRTGSSAIDLGCSCHGLGASSGPRRLRRWRRSLPAGPGAVVPTVGGAHCGGGRWAGGRVCSGGRCRAARIGRARHRQPACVGCVQVPADHVDRARGGVGLHAGQPQPTLQRPCRSRTDCTLACGRSSARVEQETAATSTWSLKPQR